MWHRFPKKNQIWFARLAICFPALSNLHLSSDFYLTHPVAWYMFPAAQLNFRALTLCRKKFLPQTTSHGKCQPFMCIPQVMLLNITTKTIPLLTSFISWIGLIIIQLFVFGSKEWVNFFFLYIKHKPFFCNFSCNNPITF